MPCFLNSVIIVNNWRQIRRNKNRMIWSAIVSLLLLFKICIELVGVCFVQSRSKYFPGFVARLKGSKQSKMIFINSVR